MEARTAQTLVDYAKSLDCIHCGLCVSSCPTYQLTGVESSSPRGRVHMMRAVAEGRLEPDAGFAEEMGFCLLCRHCESVCPAGVRFGAMMELTRDALPRHVPLGRRTRLLRWLGFRVALPRRGVLQLAAGLLRLGQKSGALRLLAPLLRRLGIPAADLPSPPPAGERRPLPERSAPVGEARGAAAVLEGCVMPVLFGRVNRATVDVLTGFGVEVHCPRAQGCCGSLHAHNGDLEEARRLARASIEAFEAAVDRDGQPLPVVVNSAGCASHLKELHHLFGESDPWHPRAQALAARVRDFAEFVAPLLTDEPPRLVWPQGLPGPVTWDDPCHLCHGQQIRAQPRALLDSVDGLERVELADSESCCGSAGIYSLLRPADSAAVLEPRLDALEASGARLLVTANPGCQMQWEAGLRRRGSDVWVLHLAELLAAARRAGLPRRSGRGLGRTH